VKESKTGTGEPYYYAEEPYYYAETSNDCNANAESVTERRTGPPPDLPPVMREFPIKNSFSLSLWDAYLNRFFFFYSHPRLWSIVPNKLSLFLSYIHARRQRDDEAVHQRPVFLNALVICVFPFSFSTSKTSVFESTCDRRFF